jgi:uncharacterized protein (TIRG00374 family)
MSLSLTARLGGTTAQRIALAGAVWVGASLALVAATFWWQAAQEGGLGPIDGALLVPAMAFAAMSFGLRTLRWHFFVRAAGARPGWWTSLRSQLVGFSLTMTPGKIGELYKCYMMEQSTGLPTARTAPIVLFEKMMDAAAFSGLAIITAAVLPGMAESIATAARTLIVVGIGAVALAVLLRITSPTMVAALLLRISRSSVLGRRLASALSQAVAGGADVLKPKVLAGNLAASFVARTCDGIALAFAAWSLGIDIPLLGGIFALNSSGALGGLSMLPGGIGVVETSMAVLLASFGATPAAALAGTLIARLLTFWSWVAVGLYILVRSEVVGERFRPR